MSELQKGEESGTISFEEVMSKLEIKDLNSSYWVNQGKYFVDNLEQDMIENSPARLKEKEWEEEFKEMWSKSSEYILINQVDNVHYSIDRIHLKTGQHGLLIEVDYDCYEFIVKKMLENNMPIYEYAEINGEIKLVKKDL